MIKVAVPCVRNFLLENYQTNYSPGSDRTWEVYIPFLTRSMKGFLKFLYSRMNWKETRNKVCTFFLRHLHQSSLVGLSAVYFHRSIGGN